MEGYKKFEILKEILGVEQLLDELILALNEKELQENAGIDFEKGGE